MPLLTGEPLEGVEKSFPETGCTISLNVSTTFVSIGAMLLCDGLELTIVGGVKSAINWYKAPLMPASLLSPLSFRTPAAKVTVKVTQSSKPELGSVVLTSSEKNFVGKVLRTSVTLNSICFLALEL